MVQIKNYKVIYKTIYVKKLKQKVHARKFNCIVQNLYLDEYK